MLTELKLYRQMSGVSVQLHRISILSNKSEMVRLDFYRMFHDRNCEVRELLRPARILAGLMSKRIGTGRSESSAWNPETRFDMSRRRKPPYMSVRRPKTRLFGNAADLERLGRDITSPSNDRYLGVV